MIYLRHLRHLRTFKTSTSVSSVAANRCQNDQSVTKHRFHLSKPVVDQKFLLDENNFEKINENTKLRKGVGDLLKAYELNNKLKESSLSDEERNKLEQSLHDELKKFPNQTHPAVKDIGDDPKVIAYFNEEPKFKHEPLEFSEICKKINILRTDHLSNFSGHKTYYLMNDLAELEHALIRYTLDEILSHGFSLMSVPDILPAEVIKACGMETDGERNQVYRTLPSNLCLSGTSEMALAGFFAGAKLKYQDTPVKVTAVSRCFRAETSGLNEEKGIYRVHQFTKVEMFSVCHSSQSESMLDEFKDIEISLFNKLGLHFKLLDMPPSELGAPAYRKYDIEAWMPGRKMWGEISSCSNCTDYQARRLNTFIDDDFAHTVNGTACAIPRMLIAIIETFQKENGTILIPKVLQKYMKQDKISKKKILPELKLVKSIPKS